MPNIKNWIMATLLAVAVATTYLSYHLYGSVQVVKEQLESARKQIAEKDDTILKLDASCGITSAVTNDWFQYNKQLGQTTSELLVELETYKQTVEKPHEPKPLPKPPTVATPSGQPDPDLQRLLDAAYCAASHDSTCTAQ